MSSSAIRQPWCNLGWVWLVLGHQGHHIVKLQHQEIYSIISKSDHLMRGMHSGLHLPLHQSFCMYSVHHRLWRMKQWTSYLAWLLLWVLKTEEWAGGRWGRQRRAHCNGKHRLQWEKRKTTYCLIDLIKSNSMTQSISHLSLQLALSNFDHLFKWFFQRYSSLCLK